MSNMNHNIETNVSRILTDIPRLRQVTLSNPMIDLDKYEQQVTTLHNQAGRLILILEGKVTALMHAQTLLERQLKKVEAVKKAEARRYGNNNTRKSLPKHNSHRGKSHRNNSN